MAGQFGINVDIVFCIDGTKSMRPIIEDVKDSVKNFHGKITEAMVKTDRSVKILRVKVIVFRDYYCDGDKSMTISNFFTLPEQTDEFNSFVSAIKADGGDDDDELENALEAIALAIKSDWNADGTRKRNIIMVWTDASAHKLEKASEGSNPANYPQDIPSTLTELSDMWNDNQYWNNEYSAKGKRLVVFAPETYPWNEIGMEWENTAWVPSKAGQGMEDADTKTILDVLVGAM